MPMCRITVHGVARDPIPCVAIRMISCHVRHTSRHMSVQITPDVSDIVTNGCKIAVCVSTASDSIAIARSHAHAHTHTLARSRTHAYAHVRVHPSVASHVDNHHQPLMNQFSRPHARISILYSSSS